VGVKLNRLLICCLCLRAASPRRVKEWKTKTATDKPKAMAAHA